MAFYVTVVSFPMTLLMNEPTNMVTGDWHLDEKHLVTSDYCKIVNLERPSPFTKNKKTMLRLQFSVGDTTWAVND